MVSHNGSRLHAHPPAVTVMYEPPSDWAGCGACMPQYHDFSSSLTNYISWQLREFRGLINQIKNLWWNVPVTCRHWLRKLSSNRPNRTALYFILLNNLIILELCSGIKVGTSKIYSNIFFKKWVIDLHSVLFEDAFTEPVGLNHLGSHFWRLWHCYEKTGDVRAKDDVNVTEILWQCNCSEVWWRSFVSNESRGVKRTERFDSSIMRERLDMACKIPVKKSML